MQKILNENTTPEFIGQIIDVIEDELEQRQAEPSSEKEYQAAKNNKATEDTVIIYGTDYDAIADEIRTILKNNPKRLTESIADAAMRCIRKNLQRTKKIKPLGNTHKAAIYRKIVQTCMNWGLS